MLLVRRGQQPIFTSKYYGCCYVPGVAKSIVRSHTPSFESILVELLADENRSRAVKMH